MCTRRQRFAPIGEIRVNSVEGADAAVLYGAIEGGGTKFVCAVGPSPARFLDSTTIPTSDPVTTLAECVRFFHAAQDRHGRIAAFGFSCFGPIELRPAAAGFGRMMSTPKI